MIRVGDEFTNYAGTVIEVMYFLGSEVLCRVTHNPHHPASPIGHYITREGHGDQARFIADKQSHWQYRPSWRWYREEIRNSIEAEASND